jgi:hypothetical protein
LLQLILTVAMPKRLLPSMVLNTCSIASLISTYQPFATADSHRGHAKASVALHGAKHMQHRQFDLNISAFCYRFPHRGHAEASVALHGAAYHQPVAAAAAAGLAAAEAAGNTIIEPEDEFDEFCFTGSCWCMVRRATSW